MNHREFTSMLDISQEIPGEGYPTLDEYTEALCILDAQERYAKVEEGKRELARAMTMHDMTKAKRKIARYEKPIVRRTVEGIEGEMLDTTTFGESLPRRQPDKVQR